MFSEKIEIVEPKPTTMTEKLRRHLLSNYNPYSLPVLQEDHHVAVFMHLTFHHVKLVSEKLYGLKLVYRCTEWKQN
jgi:hypothetical protein